MTTLSASQMRAIDGGYSTTCPICGKKVSVGFLSVLFLGKKLAYAKAQEEASAQHYSYKSGYKATVSHR